MTDQEEPEERRTEGVRIIGAQEAAEAAARPDVVRRRRGSEKRFGDRPDKPAPSEDLPKVKISTTDSDPTVGPDRFGSVPAVPLGTSSPDVRPAEPEPKWSDDRESVGHARIVANDPETAPVMGAEAAGPESVDPDPVLADAGPSRSETQPASDEPFDGSDSYDGSDGSDGFVVQENPLPPEQADPVGDRAAPEPPGSLSDAPVSDWEPSDTWQPSGGDHLADTRWSDPEPAAEDAFDSGTGDPFDDSFILPHWTEPPTGQVPKVVIGEEEPEPLATYGNQPRWRDEGERTVATDFDDLTDDEPRLGALLSDPDDDDFFSDGPFVDDRFVDEGDPDEAEDAGAARAPRAGQRTQRPARQRSERRGEPERGGSGAGAGGGDRDLTTAVLVGVGLVALGLVCFFLGGLATALLATVVVTFAAFEYFTAVRSVGTNPATLLGLVAVAGLMLATYFAGLAAYPIVIALAVIFGLLWYLWVAPGEHAVSNLGLTMLGIIWIGVLGSFATLFLGLGKVAQDADSSLTSNPGIGVLIAAVIVAVSHDVGAYFVGKYLGRTPLSAASPNKTQEGLAGGVLSAVVVTVVVVQFIGLSPVGGDLARTFVFALLCALAAPLGDLAESFVKRDLGIKDMGATLPGHGGVLDRFDAMLFVLPTAYFVTTVLGMWTSLAG